VQATDAPSLLGSAEISATTGRATRRLLWATLIAVAVVATFAGTLRNGFLELGFDDAIIVDTVALRALGWANLRAFATDFVHAHYTPLTMLSLALDYRLWGLDPLGYHLTNVLLHAANAVLVYLFLCGIVRSETTAAVAALLFAVHPVQMEAVSVAIQRKTLLSGTFFFVALLLYQRWWRTGRPWIYWAAFLSFVAAALAKPIVVTLPLVLLLYESVFVRQRPRLPDKLPFVLVGAAVALAAAAAHRAVGAVHPPHGNDLVTHVLMVARVTLEYVVAVFLPVNLSPTYYYPLRIGRAPLNFAALALLALGAVYVTARRRELPWSFFCLGWFLLTLLPEANVFPLAQLRADRFLYLPMVGAALWIALGVERLGRLPALARMGPALGFALAAGLALLTASSTPIWRDDLSAWNRVVERHPWAAVGYTMLGRAHAARGERAAAEAAFRTSLRLKEDLADTHWQLANLYEEAGLVEPAMRHLERFLELSPGDAVGLDLRARLEKSRLRPKTGP
jgi:tetratricopeptide (TPR) repeat protein